MPVVLLSVNNLNAQNINGTAYYQSHRKVDLKMNDDMSETMKQQMQAMFEKQFQKEYKLNFNSNESVYEEEKTLDSGPATFNSGGMQMVVSVSGGSDILYKNLNNNEYVNNNDFQGKLFLIQDELKKPNWVLTNETKQIGEYTCFKATYEKTITKTEWLSNNDHQEDKTVEELILVTAWYTPQIPISNGPSHYWGLPGLILEVNDGSESLLCTKIILNNDAIQSIKIPKKGKKVTQNEYDEIVKQKNDELREQFKSNKNGKGNTFEFRIGG